MGRAFITDGLTYVDSDEVAAIEGSGQGSRVVLSFGGEVFLGLAPDEVMEKIRIVAEARR